MESRFLSSAVMVLASLCVLCGHSSSGAEPAAPGHTFYVDVNSLGGQCDDANPGAADRPWRTTLKAFSSVRPGDTVIFRRGTYRLPRTLHTSDLKLDPSQTAPVVFKAPAGEQAVITNLRPIAAVEWKQVAITKSGKPVFAAPASRGARVTNLTQTGVPLKRAFCGDKRSWYEDTPPEAITGPGEWASSIREGRVYLCTADGEPPGDSIELCDVRGPGGNGNLISLERDKEDRCRNLRFVFENLTFETGFHGVLIRTGFVELRQCVLRKSFGDLLNTLSGRVVVDGCDFYAFGESAIDVTAPGDGPKPPGTPPMVIRNSRFHDNVNVRAPGQKGTNGVMLKGKCADIVVEGNQFYNLRTTYGALTLGGSTSGGTPGEGFRLTARNNIFRDIAGPYVVLFAGSHDCRLVNNLICNSDVTALISISFAKPPDPATANLRPQVQNNIFYRNTVKRAVVSAQRSAATGLVMDHNLIAESGNTCLLDDVEVPLKDLPQRGHQSHGVNQPPLFRDFARLDFRPARGSPTTDRGADLRAIVPHDADGIARPQGQAFDIGPFELR
ncbi:MAG: right-handed parallel beta-helix repeat-containing protein [Verrucomicrobia bacterium]|nr:right-handed parallel beta-helix repeat-containing protein [Verrucomicrobiota bacterium]